MSMDFFVDNFGGDIQKESSIRKQVEVKIKARFWKNTGSDQCPDEYSIGTIRSISIKGLELESRHTFPERTVLAFEIEDERYQGFKFSGIVWWVEKRTPLIVKRSGQELSPKKEAEPPKERYSTMGLVFNTAKPEFKDFLFTIISHHLELEPDDPFHDAEPVHFENPEDLYWEFNANIIHGRLFVPTKNIHTIGESIKIQMVIHPLLDILRLTGEIRLQGKNMYGAKSPFWMLVNITGFESDDHKKLVKYANTLNKVIGNSDLSKQRKEEAEARSQMVEAEMQTQVGSVQGMSRFIFDERPMFEGRSFTINDPSGKTMVFVDLDNYAEKRVLWFYSDETREKKLFVTVCEKTVEGKGGIHALYLKKGRPEAYLLYRHSEDTAKRSVRINLPNHSTLCTLAERSAATGKAAPGKNTMFVFIAKERILGILYKTGQYHFCLDLGDEESQTLDKKIALAASVVFASGLF